MNKPNISVRQGFAQRHRRSVLAAAVLIILSVLPFFRNQHWVFSGCRKCSLEFLLESHSGCPETHFKPSLGIHWQVRILLVLQVEPVQQQCFVF